jgi:hypothetical protein
VAETALDCIGILSKDALDMDQGATPAAIEEVVQG